jgi:hypothetical protein
VSVDRTEITSIKSKYEDEIELWKKKVTQSKVDMPRIMIVNILAILVPYSYSGDKIHQVIKTDTCIYNC